MIYIRMFRAVRIDTQLVKKADRADSKYMKDGMYH